MFKPEDFDSVPVGPEIDLRFGKSEKIAIARKVNIEHEERCLYKNMNEAFWKILAKAKSEAKALRAQLDEAKELIEQTLPEAQTAWECIQCMKDSNETEFTWLKLRGTRHGLSAFCVKARAFLEKLK